MHCFCRAGVDARARRVKPTEVASRYGVALLCGLAVPLQLFSQILGLETETESLYFHFDADIFFSVFFIAYLTHHARREDEEGGKEKTGGKRGMASCSGACCWSAGSSS